MKRIMSLALAFFLTLSYSVSALATVSTMNVDGYRPDNTTSVTISNVISEEYKTWEETKDWIFVNEYAQEFIEFSQDGRVQVFYSNAPTIVTIPNKEYRFIWRNWSDEVSGDSISAHFTSVDSQGNDCDDEDEIFAYYGTMTFTAPGKYIVYASNVYESRVVVFYIVIGGDIPSPTTPTAEEPSSWAVEQVNAAIAANLVPENLHSKYTQATTRAEFCALAVALYESKRGEITELTTFADTDDINVQKIGALGVVSGVGNGNFDPNGQLTREQAATILSRLADAIGNPLAKEVATFADNGSISSWAAEGVGQVQASGIMSGVGDNMFAPQNPYTREQSIITIMRLFDFMQ